MIYRKAISLLRLLEKEEIIITELTRVASPIKTKAVIRFLRGDATMEDLAAVEQIIAKEMGGKNLSQTTIIPRSKNIRFVK